MARPAKREVLSLMFTALTLMILCLAFFGMYSEAAEEKATLKELIHDGGAGVADETHLLSLGVGQGIWPGFASVEEAENNSPADPTRETAGAPAVVFQGWRGFALKGNESCSLRVSIESFRPVEAMSVRKLMASNLTLDEIRTEMRMDEGDMVHRGVLRIGDDVYNLDGLSMASSGNKTVLDADVSLPKLRFSQNNTTTTIGHLNVSLGEDRSVVSQGILIMRSGRYLGEYRVLLDGQHWNEEMMNGPVRLMMPRRDMMVGQGHPPVPPDLS